MKDIISSTFSHLKIWKLEKTDENIKQLCLSISSNDPFDDLPSPAALNYAWLKEYINQTRLDGKSSNGQRHLLQSVPLRLVVLDDVGCVCHAQPFTVHSAVAFSNLYIVLERILLQAKSLYSWLVPRVLQNLSYRKTKACQQLNHFWRSSSWCLSMSQSMLL